MTKVRLRFKGISKEFHSSTGIVRAVDNIDLDIYDKEIFCLMGPSGCGKSTLLFILAGLVPPTTGEVEVSGRYVKGPGSDRGVVFQQDAVFPWMTVEQNIGYGEKLQALAVEERRKITNKFVTMVGLEDFRSAWPKELSGGMRKRVDLARAYANDPDILLLDEPFGALDVMTKERMQVELQNLWMDAPKTIFYVTHDIEEAIYLGDRIGILSERPSRMQHIINVPFSRPRNPELKMDPEFIRIRREISERIMSVEWSQ